MNYSKADKRRAYEAGFRDAQLPYSVSTPYTYSVLMADYCRGFDDGGKFTKEAGGEFPISSSEESR